jgi:tetratricopeptide (TPR) repeat protein
LISIDLIDKNYTKVEKEAKRLIKKYPNWYSGYLYLGISTVFLENDYLKAKQYLDKSIELEETWEGRCWQAIVEYHQFKNYEKTLELYERAMQLNMISILEDAAASAAVSAAMKLGKWDSARWILNAQKTASQKVGNNIENYQNYQKLRTIMDAYDKEHATQK